MSGPVPLPRGLLLDPNRLLGSGRGGPLCPRPESEYALAVGDGALNSASCGAGRLRLALADLAACS
eukprot:2210412-Prymnesium_polylepis.1